MADLLSRLGGEGGGHTGDIASMILLPAAVDAVKGHNSPLTGKPVQVLGAGGIWDGRGLAACLSFGCTAAWVGTRFVCAEEAGASPMHQKVRRVAVTGEWTRANTGERQTIIEAGLDDTIRTLIYTGRPLRVRKTEFIKDWETRRADEAKKLLLSGKIPVSMEEADAEARPYLTGVVAGMIKDVQPAKTIMDEMIETAADIFKTQQSRVSGGSVISRLASSFKGQAKL